LGVAVVGLGALGWGLRLLRALSSGDEEGLAYLEFAAP